MAGPEPLLCAGPAKCPPLVRRLGVCNPLCVQLGGHTAALGPAPSPKLTLCWQTQHATQNQGALAPSPGVPERVWGWSALSSSVEK